MKYAVRISLFVISVLGHAAPLLGQDSAAAVKGSVDFNRDVRPILSNHCFQCHGEDANAREADLRLDVRSAAIEMRAIVPGQVNEFDRRSNHVTRP
ncbi:MAG: c-type cytochrome domain-containing protein [Planctomycetaceae bacterium]